MDGYPEDYLLKDLRTDGCQILDGGCGLGSLTTLLCQRIVAEGGTGRVIAVDSDENDLLFAKERLARSGLAQYAEFVHDDLEFLSSVPQSSVDHIILVNTVGWFEMDPLRTVSVAARLWQVLRAGGRLSIMDQATSGQSARPGTWERVWRAQNLLRTLQGQPHMVEISPGRLRECLRMTGFAELEHAEFAGEPTRRADALAFAERLRAQAGRLEMREARQLLNAILDGIVKDARAVDDVGPGSYVVHGRKPGESTP